MKLRKRCIHGRYDPHLSGPYVDCPGGEFLADDVLLIEKVAGGWPMWAIERVYVEANDLAGFELRILDALAAGEHAS